MKILFVTLCCDLAGIERHIATLSEALKNSAVVKICVTDHAGDGVRMMREKMLDVVALDCVNRRDWRMLPRFHRVVRDFKPDVVHEHCVPFWIKFYLRWFYKRVPYVASLHLQLPIQRTGWLNKITSKISRSPDYYLPVSNATWKYYKKFNNGLSGEVVYNCLRLQDLPQKDCAYVRSELNLDDNVQIVGMVGRFVADKDWGAFLEVARLVMSEMPNVHFVAVGDGVLKDDLHEQWRQLSSECVNVASRLHWLGIRSDARAIIGGMDVFLLLSRNEEMPTILLEAFGMMTPVAGFLPKGGTAEVVALGDDESACLITERDTRIVAENVKELLTDHLRTGHMVEAGRKILFEHFDAQKICEQKLLPVYKRLVERCEG